MQKQTPGKAYQTTQTAAKPTVQYELPPLLHDAMGKKQLTPQEISARSGVGQERYDDILLGKRTPNYSPELDSILTLGFGLPRGSPEYLSICQARTRDAERERKDPKRRFSIAPAHRVVEMRDEEGHIMPVIYTNP